MIIKLRKPEPPLGETRVIEKFLFFPKIIDGELRWLCKTKYLQKVRRFDVGGSMEWGNYRNKWSNECWL